jgi:hypothetical protein
VRRFVPWLLGTAITSWCGTGRQVSRGPGAAPREGSNRVRITFRSGAARVEPDPGEQCLGGRLWQGTELALEDLAAHSILAERLSPLPEADVAAHYQAVRVLTTGVMPQQLARITQGLVVLPSLQTVVGEAG